MLSEPAEAGGHGDLPDLVAKGDTLNEVLAIDEDAFADILKACARARWVVSREL